MKLFLFFAVKTLKKLSFQSYQNLYQKQARSRDFAKEGAFLEVWYNRKRTSPKFSLVLNEINSVFLSNFGDLQEKKERSSPNFEEIFRPKAKIRRVFLAENRWSPNKKKGLHRQCVSSRTKNLHYSGPNNGKSFTTSAPKSLWGAVFIFGAKIGLKSTKKCYFAYFLGQWGGCCPPPPPPPPATQLIKNKASKIILVAGHD